VWSGRSTGRPAAAFGAEADERATATFRAGVFATRDDFAGPAGARSDAARFSRAGFADAFADLFVARLAPRAGLEGGWRLLAFLPPFFVAFLAERTGTLGLRRLAVRLSEGRLFAFFAMTV
jgi:hypothetical protein